MRNFNIDNLPPKSFSVYGSKSNLKNIDMHNSGKKETLSELSQALEAARNFHTKQSIGKEIKNKQNGFTKLGSEEDTTVNKPELPIKHKIKKIKTDAEIKASVEKANQQNKEIGSKFNTNSSTTDILNGVLNDLF